MTYENPNEDEFVHIYGYTAKVKAGRMVMTLGEALDSLEDCPADQHKLRDPILRVGYLATMVNNGEGLRAEHLHLVPQPKD